ncbi:MAG: glycosyltransferase family 1 protein [Burkholderiales bacterium]|nr:glycosyltransferase family 1 protein [Burkholderiales bacterium]
MKILFVVGRHAYGDPGRGEGYEYSNIAPALRGLGHQVVLFDSFDRAAHADFAALNAALVQAVERERPEVVLFVFQLYEVWTETLDLLRRASPAALVAWGPDDSWRYRPFVRHVAPHLDCWGTTSHEVLAQAAAESHGNFVMCQCAAAETLLAEPLPARECRHRVSFVGAAYGNRRRWIEALAARGITVECFGYGWPNGPVDAAELPRIFRSSVISLNFGDSGVQFKGLLPYRSRQIKGRVFEVPGAGGFLLTEKAPNLERYYRPEEEIATFATAEECAKRIRHCLAHPEERDRIARAGHARTRAEHTYGRRLSALLEAALALRERSRAQRGDPIDIAAAREQIEQLASRHRRTGSLAILRATLVAPLAAIWGERRGGRAARRLVYELSWRLAGAHTYSASGWPGRLFYRES